MTSEVAEIPAETRRLLDQHPWEQTTALLLLHADRKIRRLKWRGSWGIDPPAGIQANDIVQTVYEKVLSGTRKWDPNRHPDLFEYLRDQVDSEISNLVRSSENRRLRPECVLPAGSLERKDELTPENIVLNEERQKESDEFVLGFLEFLDGEPDLQQVVEAIVDGVGKRADIARQLGIRVKEIDSRKKKLKRRYEEYQARRATASASSKGDTLHG